MTGLIKRKRVISGLELMLSITFQFVHPEMIRKR